MCRFISDPESQWGNCVFPSRPTAVTEPTSQREQGPARPPASFLPATHVCTGHTRDTRNWGDSALLPGETEAKGLR